ncbi:MAG: alpha/beta hydrolase [Gemmataceae bacterium]|nr:alpha/beta hydrolase [Gemmataceae bacterium]MDW8267295.1 alpha/beta hydrolase [Gemmataceae bacterium]
MWDTLNKLRYGARLLLSRGHGQAETIDLHGRPTVLRHAGQGPPFVYLHSSLGESMLWLPFFDAWARNFHVYVPTHPGFGQSGGFELIDSIDDMAFHYVELFDALGLDKVILGGVSLGGWIAAEFALRWPERVHKLWIADAPGFWIDDQPLPDLFRIIHDRAQTRALLFHEPDSSIARLVIGDDLDDERFLHAYQAMTVLARLVWERPYDPKLGPRLHRVRCPTLLVWGEHDRLVPPAYGEAYRRHIAGAELKLIPGCGHLPMFEREQEFVEIISRFAQA